MSPRQVGFICLAVTSLLVALGSWRFLAIGLEGAFPDFRAQLDMNWLAFAAHVTASPLALGLGVIQFIPSMRASYPASHRWIGRVYAGSIVIGGLSGLWMAGSVAGGWFSTLGFGLLAIVWLVTTGRAISAAMSRRIGEHRDWMIRSFALTFSAVTLRLQLTGFMLMGTDYPEAAPWLAWFCWLPNLIVAEWWIARSRRDPSGLRPRSATEI